MGDSAHTTHHTNPGKKSAPRLFLEDENINQNSASMVVILLQFRLEPTWPIFEKCSHHRKKTGVLMLFQGLCGGLYGQNLPYKFKNPARALRGHDAPVPYRSTR